MAIKCDLCGAKLETTFLGKLLGTQIGKKYVCSHCQRTYKNDVKTTLGKS